MSNPYKSFPDELRCCICDKRCRDRNALATHEKACFAEDDARAAALRADELNQRIA